jgi:3-deoxy-7-phosphoheptulonate synthase
MQKIKIGKKTYDFLIVAGPCAAESKQQLFECAKAIKKYGGHLLRAGVFKPRTFPESWQGVGKIGFQWLREVKEKFKIPVATEVKTPEQVDLALKYKIDVVWIGTRNSQNFDLLSEVGKKTSKTKTPVILKRGMAMRLEEWLGAARYIILAGNKNVILCERGVVTFDPKTTRNMLDLQTALVAKKESGLPVIVDPSHASGRKDLILPLCLAVKVSGLQGIMVECHPDPSNAKTDKEQQISLEDFKDLVKKLKKVKSIDEL